MEYSDGEMDYDLDSSNIKKFTPYQVGERLEANYNGDFISVKIVRKLRPNLVDKTTNNQYVVMTSRRKEVVVDELDLRRFY